MTGLILIRASCYATLALVFGTLAFTRANSYRRRTGANLWHTHSLVWGVASAVVVISVTQLPTPYVVAIGMVLSVAACSAIPLSSAARSAMAGSASRVDPDGVAVKGAAPAPRSAPVPVPTIARRAWLPDPTSRHELRYFDGSDWTDHVANAGVTSVDEL
jgi:hypothetical protein